MGRWIEALNADMAPKIVLESCHISVTEFVDIEGFEEIRRYGGILSSDNTLFSFNPDHFSAFDCCPHVDWSTAVFAV